ncbi:MAG: hypothetical protein HYR85_01705 [Planctomycetes bacterium]|nr:hypothetical protein [Planctomycetota bacterium]MBI3845983.1 hypothetical protein [Planctomycetota bacterium]
MPYQFKREPLTPDEANRFADACETHEVRLIVWTFLNTGPCVSELASLAKARLNCQVHRLTIYGKGGAYGRASKRRIVPLFDRVRLARTENPTALRPRTATLASSVHRSDLQKTVPRMARSNVPMIASSSLYAALSSSASPVWSVAIAARFAPGSSRSAATLTYGALADYDCATPWGSKGVSQGLLPT